MSQVAHAEDSCFLSRGGNSFWQSCHMQGALAFTCSAVKAGLHIWEVFPHTYRRAACTQIYIYLMLLCFFKLIQYPTEVNGWWVKNTSLLMGVSICMRTSLFLKQITVLSRLQPFPYLLYFSVQKHCIHFASLKSSLAMQETCLSAEEANGKQWGVMALSTLLGSLWSSPIRCGLFSHSPLHPQCALHLPQLCRDNLHSPSSLAATPSCPWAKKSPYCSKEHMQQSLMLTLIVPIQTTQ